MRTFFFLLSFLKDSSHEFYFILILNSQFPHYLVKLSKYLVPQFERKFAPFFSFFPQSRTIPLWQRINFCLNYGFTEPSNNHFNPNESNLETKSLIQTEKMLTAASHTTFQSVQSSNWKIVENSLYQMGNIHVFLCAMSQQKREKHRSTKAIGSLDTSPRAAVNEISFVVSSSFSPLALSSSSSEYFLS